MERREQKPTPTFNPLANTSLPTLTHTASGLEPYAGSFATDEALHLLRRTMFSPSVADLNSALAKGLSGTLDQLLATPTTEASVPVIYDARDTVGSVGDTWVDKVYQAQGATVNPIGLRLYSFKAWWMGLIVNQKLSIREKMVMFWHNHFVTETASVGDPRFSYYYLDLLRHNALGNFKDLVRQVTIDGAMLRYLNGNTNTKAAPNENYGRELQELFTIGKGPEVAPGDYTTYTEADVKAAARVLTGWKDSQNSGIVGPEPSSTFIAGNHDPANKQFSARYGNTVITGGATAADGPRELGALLDMIFAQSDTARFICRKLYRWFVYYAIDGTIEANIITPMANQLVAGNFEIAPVLQTLLSSAHFYDPANRGCHIKNPIDHLAGICRQFSIVFPPPSSPAQYYAMLNYIVSVAATMDMNPGDPPNVAGWPGYYQVPAYYELWLNTDTLPKRAVASGQLSNAGYSSSGSKIVIDALTFFQTLVPDVTVQSDPNQVISLVSQFLLGMSLTSVQKDFLKTQVFLPGLPDYEWNMEWSNYLTNPTANQSAVSKKLLALFSYVMAMPEYQLQ